MSLMSRIARILVVLVFVSLLPWRDTKGAAIQPDGSQVLAPKRAAKLKKKWGVEIVAVQLTASGSMIDFRFRIVDPDKALFLVDRTIDAYLLDQESGLAVEVPRTAKLGPLRQTIKYGPPPEERTFFILFANPGRFIQAGNKVTVVIGDFKAENLVVS